MGRESKGWREVLASLNELFQQNNGEPIQAENIGELRKRLNLQKIDSGSLRAILGYLRFHRKIEYRIVPPSNEVVVSPRK